MLELARLGFSDARSLLDDDGNLLPLKQLPDDVAAAVQAVEFVMRPGATRGEVDRVCKIKLWDKNSALEKISKHLGMFEADNRQKAPPITVHSIQVGMSADEAMVRYQRLMQGKPIEATAEVLPEGEDDGLSES